MKIAVLGYGVVGSGVVRVIERCQNQVQTRTGVKLEVAAISDIRDFPDDPYGHLVTHDANTIFANPEISIVVETIGGCGVAYEFTKQALAAGKNVVTSNKELVATHGPELLQLAADNQVRYRYEASVGGGIPIITNLRCDLAANRITEIAGIVNGTTNYILTRMEEGAEFSTALKEAQAKGYAEQDPTADVDGHDACRKLAIMASIVLYGHVPAEAIHTEGIRELTAEDARLAEESGYSLKLIASFKQRENGQVELIVAPHLIDKQQPLSATGGVFNAVQVTGDSLGDAIFYGQGAGTWPTASAVVADVIEIATLPYNPDAPEIWPELPDGSLVPHELAGVQALVRLPNCTLEDLGRFAALDPQVQKTSGAGLVIKVGGADQKPITEGELSAAIAGHEATVLRIL